MDSMSINTSLSRDYNYFGTGNTALYMYKYAHVYAYECPFQQLMINEVIELIESRTVYGKVLMEEMRGDGIIVS